MYITIQIDNLPTLKQITCTNDRAIYIRVYRIYKWNFIVGFHPSYLPTLYNIRIIFGTLKYSGCCVHSLF
jgi:hypothetical protein